MKTRRIIILLLALLLATGLLPVTAFATGTTEVSTWEGLQAALSAGDNIVLTTDVTPENPYQASSLSVPAGVTATLDLNGHSVDRGYGNQTEPGFDGSVMIINGTLTVTDSASGGAITGGFPDQYGGGVQIQGGTFNLLGGSITGNRAGKTGFFGTEGLGGGVYMQSGTFNMSGGSISGNKALGSSMGSSLGRGGGVYVTGGTFNFTGGTISGNTAGSIGGGVYLASTSSGHDGRIKVSGGAITGNTVAGAASNVYLEEGGVLAVTGALTGTIGVTMQTPGVFTSGLSGKGTKKNFTSDDAGLVVSLTDAGEAKLGVEEYPLWVGGTQVTSENAGDIPAANGTKTGTASYDAATNTLTLNNYVYEGTGSSTFSGQGVAAIYYTGQPLTVKLSGSNKLTVPQTIMDFAYGILNFSGPKTLTFSGDGSLKIECPEAAEISYGISSTGHVVIDGPMLEIITGDKGIGIYCSSGLAVEMKAGALYSKGGRFAINCAFSQTMFGQGTTKTDEKKLIPIGNTPVNLEGYAEVLYPHPDPYAKVTTAPAANTLTYNGRAQALVTAGTATGGTMKYAVTMVNQEPSSDAYTFDNTYIPTGTDAGTYYVWYKVVGDANHSDTEPTSVIATIAPVEPTITGADLVLNGSLDFRFYVALPVEFNDSSAYMRFTVHGRTVDVPISQAGTAADGKRIFSCPVYSIEMAEDVKAEFHYKSGTATLTTSIDKYLNKLSEQSGNSDKLTNLIAATRDYGHYIQPYLSRLHNFKIGTGGYAVMPAASSSITPVTAADLENYKTEWISHNNAVLDSVSYYDTFAESTTLHVLVKLKSAKTVTATVDGNTCAVTNLGGNVYGIEIPGIAANNLGVKYKVVFSESGTTICDINVSALTYVRAVLASRSETGEAEALTAFYNYFVAAKAYAN